MRLLRRIIVLLVYLDSFVCVARDEPRAAAVKRHGVDPGLRVHGARLHGRL